MKLKNTKEIDRDIARNTSGEHRWELVIVVMVAVVIFAALVVAGAV